MSTKAHFVTFLLALLVMGGEERGEARSTFIARFAQEGIGGSDLAQTAALNLHYFPGDGEAIIRTQVSCSSADVRLLGGRSALGTARLEEAVLEVDYGESPLGKESIDTLYVELIAGGAERDIPWRAAIYSSLDTGGDPAHVVAVELAIRSSLELDVELNPREVFPGEQVDLRMVVHNLDERQRAVKEVVWEWPEGLTVLGGESRTRWSPALPSGQGDTLGWKVLVEGDQPGFLTLRGRAVTADLTGSPVSEARLQVMAVPRGRLLMETEFLEVGKRGEVVYEWVNDAQEPAALEALRVEIGAAFDEIALVQKVPGSSVAAKADGQGHYVLLEEVGTLAPGQTAGIKIQVRPLRPGPFTWRSFCRPAGRDSFIPLGGDTGVRVVQSQEGEPAEERRFDHPTDLQLVSRAFQEAGERRMDGLPLRPGAQVHLQAHDKSKRNWVVEDVLTEALMQQGYGIRLSAPQEGEKVWVMHYRLVDARVVYTPLRRGWKLWHSQRRREVHGDLFLHLEAADGRVIWNGRVQAYDADQVPPGSMDLLGGAEAVKRSVVEADNKIVERGLSACIVGGLFYIFFIL